MPRKSRILAQLEAVQYWMHKDPTMQIFWEYSSLAGITPEGRSINLSAEFPRLTTWRTPGPWGEPIDETWIANASIGAATTGARALARLPSMAITYALEFIFNQAAKWRQGSGGQSGLRFVAWLDFAGRRAGMGSQHADAGQETFYANMPGLIVVVPGTAYDAKGLMNAALAGEDPVAYCDYLVLAALPIEDVPDDYYTVPIGKAAVRQEGKDLTLAYWGEVTLDVVRALPLLKSAGISVEAIDIRTLKPFDEKTVVDSVTKTKRLLVVTHGHFTADFASHVVAIAALNVSGAKFDIMAFPDAPSPASYDMMTWMTPDAQKIVERVKKLVG
ncbi:MAG: transketolase [Chloroflexi bacterium]|nr:transketolase [Chloroflexota bacterium]